MLATNDLIPKTRVNLNARVGVEKQDDTFAPNTADPTLAGVPAANLVGLNQAAQGTTSGSPDMMATVYQVKVSATSHPLPNVDTRVFYGVDGRNVSLNQYKVFVGGTGGSAADTTPGGAGNFAFVVPQEWFKQNAGAEVGYRLLPASDTKVTVGYRFDDTERSNAQVGQSDTSTASISLSSQIEQDIDGKLSFAYASRTGTLTYLGPWAFLGQTAAYLRRLLPGSHDVGGGHAANGLCADDRRIRRAVPSVQERELFLSGRDRCQRRHARDNAAERVSGNGIKQDYALVVGPDVNYRPREGLNFHLFYTYELLFYNNTGNGACSTSNTGACAGSAGYFQNKDTSSTHTVGLSGEWKVSEKLKLKGDYTLSYGTVMFGEFNGVFVANPTASYQNVTNYPDINSLMNNIKLTATYQLQPNIELIMQGIYTSFHNNDWNDTANAFQTSGATNTSILLTPGYTSPNYAIVAALAGVRLHF